MRLVYVDRLSIWSLLALVFSQKNSNSVFYLNAAIGGEKFARILKQLGILKASLRALSFHMDDIRDASGNLLYMKIEEDTMDVCFKISNREVSPNYFLKRLSPELNFNKITLYLEKIIAQEIHDIIVYLNVAQAHARNQVDCADGVIVFFMEKGLWSRYLADYARRFGIESVAYPVVKQPTLLKYLVRVIEGVRAKLQRKITRVPSGMGGKSHTEDVDIPALESRQGPLIASWYTGKSLTFDLDKRSDFFWLLKSSIQHGNVLLYFERKDIPVLKRDLDLLEEKGMQIIFLAQPRAQVISPIWHPTKSCKKLKKYLFGKIVRNFILSGITHIKRVPLFYLFKMLAFAKNYAYWYDFFYSHNIKVNINPNIFTAQHILQSAALEKCGGCSVSYQFANYWFSSVRFSSCADVMFLFSPSYQWVWKKNHSIIENYVSCGYITDYSFREVRANALQLRESLLKKGARFVLCYFDENSSDDRMSLISNERSIEIYKYFLERTLEDETIGLICKPGYPRTLGERLVPIHSLIEAVKASGRCVFVDEGGYLTERYPSEAAQAADLCVALLVGGAVALEAYLSHIPTVFLDLERLYSNPIYQKGKDKVVFNNLDALFLAIQKFRKNSASISGFGDLSSWLEDKDPFKDGNASLRMGEYISCLLEKFNQGLGREEAMRYANQKYIQEWDLKVNNAETLIMRPDREKMERMPCGS